MKLDVKKAISDVAKLKYFWVYLFICAVFVTLSSIIQSSKTVPFNSLFSNVISVLIYIPMGYIFVMVNNLLNNNELNYENETFLQNLWNCTKKGLKAFVGTIANTIIIFIFSSIIAIAELFAFIKITGNAIDENNLFTFPSLNIAFLVLVILMTIFMLFILKLLPVAYSKDFALKEMFCWIKVFKTFFKKGKTKDTLIILMAYIILMTLMFIVMFAVMFLFNALLFYLIKTLLVTHFVATSFLINVSNVIIPFTTGLIHYFIQCVIFHLLSQVYKREVEE